MLAMMAGIGSCMVEEPGREPLKDLSEQMDVLAILQETVGQDILKGDWDGALQMARGMDSVFGICNASFDRHQRLKEPFRDFYEKKMEKAMGQLIRSLKRRDSLGSVNRYEYLVKRCNSCHNENEVAERAHL
ncbi:hypothetical protein BC349_07145 [Flavihumibacter stibioxidans]|uniref:Cytochrome c domain-containing protein n=2 Tax=Flavihumibacter stibioxidans TaxID=1834163 RepID=A0ABR7M6Y6_9BACT|nr:hypothetical protein [Flavihumibacter stibioxidans]